MHDVKSAGLVAPVIFPLGRIIEFPGKSGWRKRGNFLNETALRMCPKRRNGGDLRSSKLLTSHISSIPLVPKSLLGSLGSYRLRHGGGDESYTPCANKVSRSVVAGSYHFDPRVPFRQYSSVTLRVPLPPEPSLTARTEQDSTGRDPVCCLRPGH